MKKKILILFFALLILLLICVLKKEQVTDSNRERILYSWDLETILEDPKTFDTILKEYQINTIYQDFKKEYLKEADNKFLKEMKEKNISVYALAGDPTWGMKEGFLRIADEINRVEEYNRKVEIPMKGIVLDIEPYISEKESNFAIEDFEVYVGEIKKTYRYLKNKNLELILAIPYWFDRIDMSLLEELVEYTDGISVMNYNIKRTVENIQEEVNLAKKYQKKINTIYEIEYGNKDYFSSLEEIINDFNQIQKEYSDQPIGISYHHYKTMIK